MTNFRASEVNRTDAVELGKTILIEFTDEKGKLHQLRLPWEHADWLRAALFQTVNGALKMQVANGIAPPTGVLNELKVLGGFRVAAHTAEENVIMEIDSNFGPAGSAPTDPTHLDLFSFPASVAEDLGRTLLAKAGESKATRN